jgi:hypothetical protein
MIKSRILPLDSFGEPARIALTSATAKMLRVWNFDKSICNRKVNIFSCNL